MLTNLVATGHLKCVQFKFTYAVCIEEILDFEDGIQSMKYLINIFIDKGLN